jgi:hypothetical protein
MLENEILELISKNLPAQVGETLKKRIILVDDLEEERDELLKKSKDQKKLIDDYEKTIQNYGDALKIKSENDNKLLDIEKRARNFELEITKLKLDESLKRENQAINIVSLVFKSPVYRTTANKCGNVPTVEKYSNGGEYVGATHVNLQETTSEEII